MSTFTPPQLLQVLQQTLPTHAPLRLCVALSGGADSVVLLHALAMLRASQASWLMRAVHVNHQLQAASTQWATSCSEWAQALQVPCTLLSVDVSDADIVAMGLEAAARKARYRAFKEVLQPEEVLLTAHHADDQLETVLLALMRGAGLKGLSAMPRCVRFGAGWHARPLLDFTRESLMNWARSHSLPHVTDPSNDDRRFDRNYLRHELIPRLTSRWPAAASAATRSAAHLAEAQTLLDESLMSLWSQAQCGRALRVAVLRSLPSAQRRALLRHWLHQRELLMPSTRILETLEHDMLHAQADRIPCVRWKHIRVFRHRELLYAESTLPERALSDLTWNIEHECELPGALGALLLHQQSPSSSAAVSSTRVAPRIAERCLPASLQIRWRAGGESLQPSSQQPRRELRKLLQEQGVLPWWRSSLPLLYADERLLAVGDLWIDASVAASDEEAGYTIEWRDRPSLFACATADDPPQDGVA